MTNNNFLSSFFKLSLITTLLFGGLLAQSYATNLITDSIMRLNVEFTVNPDENTIHQTASIPVKNEQNTDFIFDNHQIEVKTTFIENADLPASEQQFLAELKIKQLGESGQFELIGSPSMLILRNKWAEFKLNSDDQHETIQFKLQYEEDPNITNDSAMLDEPVWLNWGDKLLTQDMC